MCYKIHRLLVNIFLRLFTNKIDKFLSTYQLRTLEYINLEYINI